MKRFYSFLAMSLACIVAFAASVTVTFKVDNPEAVTLYDSNNYNSETWETDPTPWGADNTITVTIDSNTIRLTPTSGYEMTACYNEADEWDKIIYSPTSETKYIYSYTVEDGATYIITTGKIQPKIVNITGDPNAITVSNGGEAVEAVDGVFSFEVTDKYGSIYINSKNGYLLESVKDENGEEKLYNKGASEFYLSAYYLHSGDNNYTVTALNVADTRTDKVVVNVVGDPAKLKFSRYATGAVTLTEGMNEVPYNPEIETPFTIEPVSYGTYLYKVEVNGTDLEANYGGGTWSINNPQNGDIITIYTEFPDIQVPVHITFTNEGTEDAVSKVTVAGQEVPREEWLSDNFTVKLGSKIVINFSSLYNWEVVGAYVYGDYEKTILTETPLNIEIKATKMETIPFTVVCNDPDQILVCYGYGTDEPYTLTGTTTVLELPKQTYMRPINISAKDGYKIVSVIRTDTTADGPVEKDITGNLDYIYVEEEGVTFTVTSEVYERPLTGVLYQAPGQYESYYVSLDNYGDFQMQIEMKEGYNFFNFCEADMENFWINYYPYPAVYLGTEQLEKAEFGNTYGLEDYKGEKAIKVFPAEAVIEPLKVTTEVSADYTAALEVDYVEPIENIAEFTVLPGTHVSMNLTQLANHEIITTVTANDVTVEADENGLYNFTIAEDTKIKVATEEKSALSSIAADLKVNNDIYNLQGILVKKAATPDDVKALPAGLYIIGGKKVVIK